MMPDAFKEKYHHIIAGLVLDAATVQRSGVDLSLWLKQVLPRVDSVLMRAYHDARGEDPPSPPAEKPRKSTFRPADGQAKDGPVGAAPSAEAPKDAKPPENKG